jgi:hypothetical protein
MITGSLNQFLDRYVAMIAQIKGRNEGICWLMTLITDVFLYFRRFIATPKRESKVFLRHLTRVLVGSEAAVCVCAFRSFIAVFDVMWLEYKLPKRQDLLMGLLEATEYPSMVHHLAIRYVMSIKCPKFRYMTLCKNLTKQGIREPRDVNWLEQLLMIPKVKKPLVGLKFLAMVGADDRIWAKSAVGALIQPLNRCHALEEVKIWLPIFIKKLTVFVGACIARKRYRHRQMMVGQLLKALLRIEANWVIRCIGACYGALISKRCCPFGLPVDLAGIQMDHTVCIETEMIANSQISLKEFFTTTNVARVIIPTPRPPPSERPPARIASRKLAAKSPKVAIAVPKLRARQSLRSSPSSDSLKSSAY